MRQVFTSLRLENVESVAQILRDAGIEVRITNGRSYKGKMRSRASYSDDSAPKPAVWSCIRRTTPARAKSCATGACSNPPAQATASCR
jgi:hypothetical protein